jgi:hypothetical protein
MKWDRKRGKEREGGATRNKEREGDVKRDT